VKVKLDENIPISVVGMLVGRGHDVDTVVAENLTAAADETIVQAAAAAGRLLLTLDRGVGDLRRHPPGSHSGIVVLRLHDQSAAAVRRIIDQLTETNLENLAGSVTVVQPGLLRIRRPPGAGSH
jgi:predicted nuclease of predicted toxin-antitoxin system